MSNTTRGMPEKILMISDDGLSRLMQEQQAILQGTARVVGCNYDTLHRLTKVDYNTVLSRGTFSTWQTLIARRMA